jgi:hypothetical protein
LPPPPQVRWMVQVPRLYEIYRASGEVASFGDMLRRIFDPLFAVSLDPASDPKLHQFLALVVGFDSVDDESKQELHRDATAPPSPDAWTSLTSPPYYYWTHYLSTNLCVLNALRRSRGMTEFSFRPHAGEAGEKRGSGGVLGSGATRARTGLVDARCPKDDEQHGFTGSCIKGFHVTSRAHRHGLRCSFPDPLPARRRPGPPSGGVPHRREHQPRHQPQEEPGAAVPVLPQPGACAQRARTWLR